MRRAWENAFGQVADAVQQPLPRRGDGRGIGRYLDGIARSERIGDGDAGFSRIYAGGGTWRTSLRRHGPGRRPMMRGRIG